MTTDNGPPQLQMRWPEKRLKTPPEVRVPPGYRLRSYQPSDSQRFYHVMQLAGWPDWDDARLRPWLARLLPGGWFVIQPEDNQEIVATAMALANDDLDTHGAELGWVACDPKHTGHGLGLAISAAVTAHCIADNRQSICLYSEDFRSPALRTYLKLGYLPCLYLPEMYGRWREICLKVNWPFQPHRWSS